MVTGMREGTVKADTQAPGGTPMFQGTLREKSSEEKRETQHHRTAKGIAFSTLLLAEYGFK